MNYAKTAILLAAMTAFFGFIGFLIGGASGMMIALVIAVGMNFYSYWNSDKTVLRQHGAHLVTAQSEPDLIDMVATLARNANMPMPKVYIIDNDQPNAFATGRNPNHAAVAVTTGLFRRLSPEELAGVIAHELAHIKNYDTLIMTVTASIAGAITMLINFSMFFRSGNRGGFLLILLISLLAPIAAAIVQMAVSRTREYSADKMGAFICGNPIWLADALRKIESFARGIDNEAAEDHPATAHMFIINPLNGRQADKLFSTHPNTANRISELETLYKANGASAKRFQPNPGARRRTQRGF